MWCVECQRPVPDCVCPDIGKRLNELMRQETLQLAALQNKIERDRKTFLVEFNNDRNRAGKHTPEESNDDA